MPGTNQINRKRINTFKERRQRTKVKRERQNKLNISSRESLILTKHQKKVLRSNPNANLEIRNKKKKQILKAIKHQLGEKADKEMSEVGIVEEDSESEMEISGTTSGTTLGQPSVK